MKKLFFIGILVLVSASLLFANGDGENSEAVEQSPSSYFKDNFSLEWSVEGKDITFTLRAKTTGWISVGFNPSQVMVDAQIIIGAVTDGETLIRDDFGNGLFTHIPDTAAGGTDDITLLSGREADGWTELVFSIPIDSGDEYDSRLTLGKSHKVLIAYGPDGIDSFKTKHSFKTSFTATFGGAEN